MKWLVIVLVACSGCALLQKAEPIRPTYLTPYEVDERVPVREVADQALAVRLRRVRSAEHLGARIVMRRDGHDIEFLEGSRWNNPPSEIVEARIGRVLFERRGVTRIVGGDGPTLEIVVRAFELVAGSPALARVQITALLHDDGLALFEETLTFEQPVPRTVVPDEADPKLGPMFAEAMGHALDEAVAALSHRVIRALARQEAIAER